MNTIRDLVDESIRQGHPELRQVLRVVAAIKGAPNRQVASQLRAEALAVFPKPEHAALFRAAVAMHVRVALIPRAPLPSRPG